MNQQQTGDPRIGDQPTGVPHYSAPSFGDPSFGDRVLQLLDNPLVVLGLVFLVFAAAGIPLIWMCRGFSTAWKTVLTVAALVYTVLLCWITWLILAWCYERILNAL